MAIQYGEDYVYASEKLHDSYLEYGSKLVRVLEVSHNGKCVLEDLNGRIIEQALVKDINTEPVKLGYVNLNNVAGYVTRMPARHYRQGFRLNTIYINSCLGRINTPKLDYSFELSHLNKFPTLENCIESVFNKERVSTAFSKIFSVFCRGEEVRLEYKAKEVGSVDIKKDEIILDNKFLFLEDVLEPCL